MYSFAHGSRKRLTEMIIETHCLGKKTKTVRQNLKLNLSSKWWHTVSLENDWESKAQRDSLHHCWRKWLDCRWCTCQRLSVWRARGFSPPNSRCRFSLSVAIATSQKLLRPLLCFPSRKQFGHSIVFTNLSFLQVKALLVDGTSRPNVSLVVSTTLMKRPSVSPSDKGYGILRKDLPDKSFVTGIDGKVLVELKEIPSYMEVAVIKVRLTHFNVLPICLHGAHFQLR